MKSMLGIGAALIATAAVVGAQQTAPSRPASPTGTAATQVGGSYAKDAQGRERYSGGKWLEISYGRPIKRGRADLWGTGADYGKTLNAGAPVWRAGANQTTRLMTEAPIKIGDKTVPAGEYSVFVELKSPTEWTLILSSWPAQQKFDQANKEALWGSYGYTADKDVARVAMKVDKLPMSIDQLTWGFADVSQTGGSIYLMWGNVVATAPFTVAQ
jgi:hypothetical protein